MDNSASAAPHQKLMGAGAGAEEVAAGSKPRRKSAAEKQGARVERKPRPQADRALKCPRCDATNTKFCYYNNYSLAQPRYFCKECRRYWTQGGTLRNVPVGGGSRKNRRSSKQQLVPPQLHSSGYPNVLPTFVSTGFQLPRDNLSGSLAYAVAAAPPPSQAVTVPPPAARLLNMLRARGGGQLVDGTGSNHQIQIQGNHLYGPPAFAQNLMMQQNGLGGALHVNGTSASGMAMDAAGQQGGVTMMDVDNVNVGGPGSVSVSAASGCYWNSGAAGANPWQGLINTTSLM